MIGDRREQPGLKLPAAAAAAAVSTAT